MALDSPGEGALSATAALTALRNRPWEANPAFAAAMKSDPTELLSGAWDPQRADVPAADQIFRSTAFQRSRETMCRNIERGWQDAYSAAPGALGMGPWSEYRAWATWFAAHSRWARESQRDWAVAAEDWRMMFGLGRQLTRCRTGISQLVGSVCDAMASQEMMLATREDGGTDPLRALLDSFRVRALGQREPKNESIDIRALADYVLAQRLPGNPSDWLAGERLEQQSLLEHIYVREGGNWLDVSVAAAGGSPALTTSRIWNLTSPVFHDLDTARRRVDASFASLDQYIDLMHCPYDRGSSLPRQQDPDERDGALWFVSWTRWVHGAYESRCRVEAALTMLALREYRQKHGQFPETLDALVPEFLPRLPIDYANRQPLRYRRTHRRYVLYSVGLNGIDDGGQGGDDPGWMPRFIDKNPDVVFTKVHRLERRK